MKKTIFLLGAIFALSTNVFAEEVTEKKFKVDKISQNMTFENRSGGAADIAESAYLTTDVFFSYGKEYTFSIRAREYWEMDTDNGISGKDDRIELGAKRNFYFDNGVFGAGLKVRKQDKEDRLILDLNYKYGLLSGWATPAYSSNDGGKDYFYLETMPLNLSLGKITVGPYWESIRGVGEDKDYKYDKVHLRAYAPLYQGEKLSVNTEYRLGLNQKETTYDKTAKRYRTNYAVATNLDGTNYHRIYISANYKATENFDIYGYYGYEFSKWETSKDSTRKSYYGEACLGWSYSF